MHNMILKNALKLGSWDDANVFCERDPDTSKYRKLISRVGKLVLQPKKSDL